MMGTEDGSSEREILVQEFGEEARDAVIEVWKRYGELQCFLVARFNEADLGIDEVKKEAISMYPEVETSIVEKFVEAIHWACKKMVFG